jgi:hypothetical protein
MVIGKVVCQQALHMPLMQDDYVIQTRSPDTANAPLHIGILPRTLWSGQHFLNAHTPHTQSKGRAVDPPFRTTHVLLSHFAVSLQSLGPGGADAVLSS